MTVMIGRSLAVTPGRSSSDSRMSGNHLKVLQILCMTDTIDDLNRRQGYFSITQTLLAKLAKLDRSTVNPIVRDLVDWRYLDIRPQKTLSGGTAAHLYKVLYDEVLPAEFDLWADILGPAINDDAQGDPLQTVDKPDVGISDRGVSENSTGGPNATETVLSENPTGVCREIRQHETTDVGKSDSSIKESDSVRINTTHQQVLDSCHDMTRHDVIQKIVSEFEVFRERFRKQGPIPKPDGLALQAADFLDEAIRHLGLSEPDAGRLLIEILDGCTQENADKDLQRPFSIKFYATTIRSRIKAEKTIAERRKAETARRTAAPPPVPPAWTTAMETLRADPRAADLIPWLDVMTFGGIGEGGTVRICAASATARAVIEENVESVVSALQRAELGSGLDVVVRM